MLRSLERTANIFLRQLISERNNESIDREISFPNIHCAVYKTGVAACN